MFQTISWDSEDEIVQIPSNKKKKSSSNNVILFKEFSFKVNTRPILSYFGRKRKIVVHRVI